MVIGSIYTIAAESYRVAVVKSRALQPYQEATNGILAYLKGIDVDVHVDQYNLEGDAARGGTLATKIKENNTDLLFTVGSEAFDALREQVASIPVVFSMIYESMEGHETEGVYGAYLMVPYVNQFQLLRDFVPEVERVAIIYQKKKEAEYFPALEEAANTSGLQLIKIPIDALGGLSVALEKAGDNADALFMVLDKQLYNMASTKKVLLFSARRKFPIISFSPQYVKAGALISFSSYFYENGVTAASVAADVLKKGAVDEPFVPTQTVWVAWNSRVAKVFGVSLSRSAKKRINEIF